MARSVRMADIAARLGISIVSVSKGLSGKEGVSDEMRARILATAKELGYQGPAKTESARRSANIGILVADRHFDDSAFYSSLYRAVVNSCGKVGYNCMLEIVMPQAEDTCTMPTLLTAGKVDALIFMGELRRRYISTALQHSLPYMFLDFYDDAIAGDSVLSDNTSGGYQMTEHLLQTGRTRIGFVGSIQATSSIMDRYLGYCRALLMAGIEPRADWRLEDRGDDGKWVPFTLPKEMPEAFVCNCDEVAFNLIERLHREGYEVPRDIAVTGYDDYRFSVISRPQLTSYRIDVDGMAAAVVMQLRRKLNGKQPYAPTTLVPGAFVRREST